MLDASIEAAISDTIGKLRYSTTVVVIAQRLSTIQHADSVFVLEDGLLIATGRFPEERKQIPLIEEYLRLMSFDSIDD